jgi:type I restriction enzyme S subunit
MSDVKRLRFADLGELFDGPHSTPTRVDTGPYFLNIASLRSGRLDLSESDHVSESDFIKWTRRVTPQADDLLFSYETRLGEAALMPANVTACLGRRMALLRPNPSVVHPRFLLYLFLSPEFRRLIEKNTIHGATVNRIGLSTMGEWPVALPGLCSQKAIAAVLGALDDKIAANTDLISTAGSLAVSIAETFDDMTPLAEVVTHHKHMVSPESVADCLVEHYSLPAFDASNTPEEVAPSVIKSGKFSVDQPCVLVSKLNPRFPRIWDVPAVGPAIALASTEFLVLESRYSTPTVLWAVLSQPSFSASLETQVAGTSGSHQRVKPADLLSTAVIDPRSMSDSAKDKITSLGQSIASYRQESRKLAELRDALLPELISGRLRVLDAVRVVGREV